MFTASTLKKKKKKLWVLPTKRIFEDLPDI